MVRVERGFSHHSPHHTRRFPVRAATVGHHSGHKRRNDSAGGPHQFAALYMVGLRLRLPTPTYACLRLPTPTPAAPRSAAVSDITDCKDLLRTTASCTGQGGAHI